MSNFEELHAQNHELAEYAHVLAYLIQDRSLCDTKIVQDLFFSYIEKIKTHFDAKGSEIYGVLLRSQDEECRKVADRFMGGSVELDRILKEYLKKWSRHNSLRIRNHHAAFVQETLDISEIVHKRIQDETEHLYPLVRRLSAEAA